MTSRDDDLTARIRQQTESTMQEHGETLRASANNELRITEADINQMHGQIRDMLPRTKAEVEKQIAQIHAALEKGLARTQSLLLRAWLRPLMVGIVISLGIFGASWGLMQWLSSRVQNLLETQETLQLGIAQQQRDLELLQAQTWGVWLHEEDGMRYVVLPRGTFNEEWPVTVGGQPAVRLSSE